MMKSFSVKSLITLIAILFSFNAYSALMISPTYCDDTGGPYSPGYYECWTINVAQNGGNPSQPGSDDVEAWTGTAATLDDLYKGSPGDSDEGLLAGSYSSAFANDNEDGTVTYDGGDYIDCFSDECYLSVKDGNHDPFFYIFNLSDIWDGMETIDLSGFWPEGGAISNVAIWAGASDSQCVPSSEDDCGGGGGGSGDDEPIPEPQTLLIFAAALFGIYISRRKRLI